MNQVVMRQLYKIASLSVLIFGLGQGISHAAVSTYEWKGDPGYYGTLVLDAPSSTGGSISDIVSLEIITPINGTLVENTYTPNGDIILADPVFTWNASQITEMGIETYNGPSRPEYLVAAQNYDGTGLNQASGPAGPPVFDDIDTHGEWVAEGAPGPASAPEPVPLMYCLAYVVPLGSIAFRVLRRKRA